MKRQRNTTQMKEQTSHTAIQINDENTGIASGSAVGLWMFALSS